MKLKRISIQEINESFLIHTQDMDSKLWNKEGR